MGDARRGTPGDEVVTTEQHIPTDRKPAANVTDPAKNALTDRADVGTDRADVGTDRADMETGLAEPVIDLIFAFDPGPVP